MPRLESQSRYRECEAPIHHPDCPCPKCQKPTCESCNLTNRDHFTPKCIATIFKWTPQQVGAKDNLQFLSLACHQQKDTSTKARKFQAKKLVRGRRKVTMSAYKRMLKRNGGYINVPDSRED